MTDESKRSYLFVAIDRATNWVLAQIKTGKTARSASSFLKALHKCLPHHNSEMGVSEFLCKRDGLQLTEKRSPNW